MHCGVSQQVRTGAECDGEAEDGGGGYGEEDGVVVMKKGWMRTRMLRMWW